MKDRSVIHAKFSLATSEIGNEKNSFYFQKKENKISTNKFVC